MTISDISKLLHWRWVQQIRAGDKHRFIDITIVEVDGRFFVRQYKFGQRSWYHAFLQDPRGEMKLRDTVIPIHGVVPKDLEEINPRVNRAYRKKFSFFYGIMRLTYDTKKHEASTLELVPQL